jgi:hypothetical protein
VLIYIDIVIALRCAAVCDALLLLFGDPMGVRSTGTVTRGAGRAALRCAALRCLGRAALASHVPLSLM